MPIFSFLSLPFIFPLIVFDSQWYRKSEWTWKIHNQRWREKSHHIIGRQIFRNLYLLRLFLPRKERMNLLPDECSWGVTFSLALYRPHEWNWLCFYFNKLSNNMNVCRERRSWRYKQRNKKKVLYVDRTWIFQWLSDPVDSNLTNFCSFPFPTPVKITTLSSPLLLLSFYHHSLLFSPSLVITHH